MSAEADRLRYLQLKAKAGGPAVEEEEEESATIDPQGGPIRERTFRQNIADTTNQYAQGLSSGWIDEGAAALEATMDVIRGNDIRGADGEQADWGTRRSSYLDRLKTDRDIFSRENPKTSAALEIAGGINQAVVTRKLPTLGGKARLPGGPLQKSGLPQSLQKRAAKEVGRAGVEGAVYGAGTADEGDRTGGAVRGASTDIATNLVLKGAGKVVKGAANNRVAQELRGKAGEFIPLNMTGGKLGKLYEDYVAKSPWGGRKVQEQADLISGKANRDFVRIQNKTSALPSTIKGEERAAVAAADTRLAASKDAAAQQKSVVDDVIDEEKAAEKLAIDVETTAQKADATASYQAQQAARNVDLQQGQAAKTLPPHAPNELHELVATETDTAKVARAIDTWWQEEGFQGIKQTDFDVDDELESFLSRYVDEADLDEIVDEGFVTGAWLMELRNNPARGSGSVGDYARGKLRMEVKDFDSQLERMLKKADSQEGLDVLKQYKDEISFYGDKQAYVGAVDKAQNKRQGAFIGDDLATAGPKRPRRYGEAPGQVAGQQGQRQATESKSALAQTKEKIDADKTSRDAAASAKAKRFKKDAAEDKAAADRAANKQKVQDTRKDKLRIKRDSRRLDAASKLKKSKSRASLLASLSPSNTAGGIGGRINAASSPGLIKQGARTAVGATGLAKLLSAEGTQRTLAGQTDTQRLIAELLRKNEDPLTLLRQGLGRYSAGQGE